MKIIKRVMIIVAVIICLVIIGNGIYLSQLDKTVVCSGEVTAVDIEKQTISITDDFNVKYLLKVKFYTSLKDINNKRIDINEIEAGDIITANYLGEWKNSESELYATYIKVAK